MYEKQDVIAQEVASGVGDNGDKDDGPLVLVKEAYNTDNKVDNKPPHVEARCQK